MQDMEKVYEGVQKQTFLQKNVREESMILPGKWNKCGQCGHEIIRHNPGAEGSTCACGCVRAKQERRRFEVKDLEDIEA